MVKVFCQKRLTGGGKYDIILMFTKIIVFYRFEYCSLEFFLYRVIFWVLTLGFGEPSTGNSC